MSWGKKVVKVVRKYKCNIYGGTHRISKNFCELLLLKSVDFATKLVYFFVDFTSDFWVPFLPRRLLTCLWGKLICGFIILRASFSAIRLCSSFIWSWWHFSSAMICFSNQCCNGTIDNLKTKFDILKKKQKEGRERKNVKGKKNKKEGRERKTEIYYFYPFIRYPIYSPTLLQQFLLVFYIYSPCIALSFIHLLYFNYIPLLHLIPILFNNLNISFTSKCVFLLLFLN